jgi:hypothetical protein
MWRCYGHHLRSSRGRPLRLFSYARLSGLRLRESLHQRVSLRLEPGQLPTKLSQLRSMLLSRIHLRALLDLWSRNRLLCALLPRRAKRSPQLLHLGAQLGELLRRAQRLAMRLGEQRIRSLRKSHDARTLGGDLDPLLLRSLPRPLSLDRARLKLRDALP